MDKTNTYNLTDNYTFKQSLFEKIMNALSMVVFGFLLYQYVFIYNTTIWPKLICAIFFLMPLIRQIFYSKVRLIIAGETIKVRSRTGDEILFLINDIADIQFRGYFVILLKNGETIRPKSSIKGLFYQLQYLQIHVPDNKIKTKIEKTKIERYLNSAPNRIFIKVFPL